MRENQNASGFSNHLGSSSPSLLPLNSSFSPSSMSFHQAAAASSPVPGQSPRKNSRSPEEHKVNKSVFLHLTSFYDVNVMLCFFIYPDLQLSILIRKNRMSE